MRGPVGCAALYSSPAKEAQDGHAPSSISAAYTRSDGSALLGGERLLSSVGIRSSLDAPVSAPSQEPRRRNWRGALAADVCTAHNRLPSQLAICWRSDHDQTAASTRVCSGFGH